MAHTNKSKKEIFMSKDRGRKEVKKPKQTKTPA